MLVKRYSAQEARENFADILGMVYYTREPVIVEKRGKPVTVMISPEDYKTFLQEREKRFAVLDRLWSEADPNLDPQEVEKAVNAEVHAVRQEKQPGKKSTHS